VAGGFCQESVEWLGRTRIRGEPGTGGLSSPEICAWLFMSPHD